MRKAFAVAVTGLAAGAAVGYAAYKNNPEVDARCWTSNGHLKYPASANFPDLTGHNNVMAKVLTPAVSRF